jgi:hypothetical protein
MVDLNKTENITKKPSFVNSILIVGCVKDCEKTIDDDIKKIYKSFKFFNSISWLLIESDSTDKTVRKLKHINKNINNFEYISLGDLKSRLPKRTQRIAYCRNKYLDQINNNPKYRNTDYVVIADFDGINNKITQEAVQSSWNYTGWDVCTANQDGPYYDIWALRHKEWCPGDWLSEYKALSKLNKNDFYNMQKSLYSKMRKIPTNSKWIRVDSSFGGLAIYKKEILKGTKYQGLDKYGQEICEHISLNLDLNKKGYKIYINPKLVNAGWTEHTKPLKSIKHFIKSLIAIIKF